MSNGTYMKRKYHKRNDERIPSSVLTVVKVTRNNKRNNERIHNGLAVGATSSVVPV